MEIKLHNIGIVKDSTIAVKGLTVITGKNNSGKTTVGKALYALLDATSNIDTKARRDRAQYVIKRLDDVVDSLDIFRLIRSMRDLEVTEGSYNLLSDYPALQTLLLRDYRYDVTTNDAESFARKLEDELKSLNIDKLNQDSAIQFFFRGFPNKKGEPSSVADIIFEQRNKALEILDSLFTTLSKDPHLIEYTRESINQTLRNEFSNQIQPVSVQVDSSLIEIFNDNAQCFSVSIKNNKVENDGMPAFISSPYKKVFLIDNPFIWDEPTVIRRPYRNAVEIDEGSLLNPSNIWLHSQKLRNLIRNKRQPTVLEQTVLNDALKAIKDKIDLVLPGTFEFSSDGDYYVRNGAKLKLANLATGSKMFSIIKLLLEKGEIDSSTMLILDEPEAHLHPAWQNKFAEIIVLLVKELKVNILLTTHSSNFVLALDAYMRKYSIEDVTNFYQTDFLECGQVEYKCVNDSVNTIYQDFLEYMSQVKMLRNECIRKAGDE